MIGQEKWNPLVYWMSNQANNVGEALDGWQTASQTQASTKNNTVAIAVVAVAVAFMFFRR